MTDNRGRNARVVAFLAIGLMAVVVAVFFIGQKSGLFESKVALYVHFQDVQGLVVGAPVRLAGLDVGMVTRIEFPEAIERTQARAKLTIKATYLNRIREDSRAKIDSKGLLGDKLIEISVGSPDLPALKDGATLQTASATSLAELAMGLDDAVSSIARAAATADEAVGRVINERTRADLGRILSSAAAIAEEIEKGDGVVHRLLYDKGLADGVAGTIGGAEQTIRTAHRAVRRVDDLLASVESGPGGLHDLVHGDELRSALSNLAEASESVRAIAGEVERGDGLLHALVYNQAEAKMLSDLASATSRLDGVLALVERGEGTIGGLMVDPTVYEDLKTILGNVERNVLLKALVRFAIKEGEVEREADVPEAKSVR